MPTVRADLRGSGVFKDIPSGSYFDDAVGMMYESGIIKGYDDGRFGPDDYVTRAQVAVMLQRFAAQMNGSGFSSTSSVSSRSSSSKSSSSSSSSVSSSSSSAATKGSFRFTVEKFSVSESAPQASVSVVRTGSSDGAVTVEYETADETAVAGTDYTSTSGKLSFASGESTKTITIALKDDKEGEAAETFLIKLKNPSSGTAVIDPSTMHITLIDSDGGSTGSSSSGGSSSSAGAQGAIGFGADTFGVMENAGTARIYVTRTDGTTGAVTADYKLTNGTADASHYIETSGSLSFAAGETEKYFDITIIDNSDIKGNKTVNMTLSNPTGGAVLRQTSAVLTILDNEKTASGTGSFKFSESEYTAYEGDTVQVVILRTSGVSGTVAITYSAGNGTAKSGADFTAASGVMTFKPGEMSKSFSVKTLKDTDLENDETIQLNISTTTNGAEVVFPYTSQITLID